MLNLESRLEKISEKEYVLPINIGELFALMGLKDVEEMFFEKLEEIIDRYFKEGKINYHTSINSAVRYNGTDFSFGIYGNNEKYSFWANKGLTSIISDTNDFQEVKKSFDLWNEGLTECSEDGCANIFDKNKPAGRLFAGMYCVDCWESKYEKIERLTNYN